MINFERYDSEIDDSFFQFDFNLGGKVFKATLNKYLIAQRTDAGELEEEEIEYLLESCAAWRECFWVAYVETHDMKRRKEQEFEFSVAEWTETARKAVIQGRKETCGGKMTASLMSSITKDEVKNVMLNNNREDYERMSAELRDISKVERLLYGSWQNLNQRGTELQSILKGKRPNQFQGEVHEPKESHL